MHTPPTTRRRKTLTTLITAMALTLGLALPAHAVTVTAPCYTGGYFYTKGFATYWQRHIHDGIRIDYNYGDTSWKSVSWGWHTGTQSGTVIGYQLTNAFAVCPN